MYISPVMLNLVQHLTCEVEMFGGFKNKFGMRWGWVDGHTRHACAGKGNCWVSFQNKFGMTGVTDRYMRALRLVFMNVPRKIILIAAFYNFALTATKPYIPSIIERKIAANSSF